MHDPDLDSEERFQKLKEAKKIIFDEEILRIESKFKEFVENSVNTLETLVKQKEINI